MKKQYIEMTLWYALDGLIFASKMIAILIKKVGQMLDVSINVHKEYRANLNSLKIIWQDLIIFMFKK
jgi:hypothetical protein